MEKKKIVVFTGAGISKASGISTFRDSDGLWANHKIEDVATHQAWRKNPQRILDFFNERRKEMLTKKPNDAHYGLVELEKKYDVTIITQNVDDLHEKAGSSKIMHLHGEITKCRAENNVDVLYDYDKDLKLGDTDKNGSQLRPHVVLFDEQVPMMFYAGLSCKKADIFVVIGSSLIVQPAASLIQLVHPTSLKYIIDPIKPHFYELPSNIQFIEKEAVEGIKDLLKILL